jgi:16S rRNA (guanine966-N2)-methyltransferase
MDRVKAAIFSSLGQHVVGAQVLDLFAGAGGLGIEALSRGAASATFVESDRQAVSAIERNLVSACFTAKVRRQNVFEFLRHARGDFDIIFADPPYESTTEGESFTDLLLANRAIPRLLWSDGVFVLEKRPGEALSMPENWSVLRAQKYGATEVVFLTPAQH